MVIIHVCLSAKDWVDGANTLMSQGVNEITLIDLPRIMVSFGPFPPRPERGETHLMCTANIDGVDKPLAVPYDDRLASAKLLSHVWPGIKFNLPGDELEEEDRSSDPAQPQLVLDADVCIVTGTESA